jgi:hypothetical protein
MNACGAGDRFVGREHGSYAGRDGTMSVYLVERDLPGISLAQFAAIRSAARKACDRFATGGKSVQYLRSTFVPGESRCLCLFEAPDAELAREVNEAAQIPFHRIVMALDLDP